VFASSFCTTCSAASYSLWNCCVTTIFRRSSLFFNFLDDFDDVDDVADVKQLILDVLLLMLNILIVHQGYLIRSGVQFYLTLLHHLFSWLVVV